jgi:DNA-binding phage protein
MNLQQHLEIQASAQQWADDFMSQYNITATEMADALTKVLLNLKDKAMVEYLVDVSKRQQEMYAAAQQEQMQSQTTQEEEVNETSTN